MAELVDVAGGEPVNDGEQRVLDALVAQLGSDVRIIPNWTVVHPKNLDECDAIVVTRDTVFVVETKDLAGAVEIGQNDFYVNGKSRSHPYIQTRKKAQRLKSKISQILPWFDQQGWVEPIVVLARNPQSLSIDPLMLGRVTGIPKIAEQMGSPSSRVHPNQVGRLVGRIDEVVEAITNGGHPRDREKYVLDGYRIDEVLFEHAESGFARLAATNLLSGTPVVAEIDPLPPDMGPKARTQWRATTSAPYRMALAIGPHAQLLSPTAAYELENGSLVVIWPSQGESAIKTVLDSEEQISVAAARQLVEDIAAALEHIHSKGFTHGSIDPLHCARGVDGRGLLRFGLTMHKASEGQASDLKMLGMLAGVLAQRTSDEDLLSIAQQLTDVEGPQLTALQVAKVFVGPVVTEPGVQSLSDIFLDLKPLTMGSDVAVYSGIDAGGASVAIKVLSGADSSDSETWHEYSILRDLENQHVVRTLGVGTALEGPYLITEFLDGISLRDVVEGAVSLPDEQKIAAVVQLLEALEEIHPDTERIAELMQSGDPDDETTASKLREAGLVHNDIEPSNVRVLPIRGAVLFDFDLAGRPGATVGGLSVGYRPADVPVDVAIADADIYAVGAILHELLTGFLPYEIDEDDNRRVRIDDGIPSSLVTIVRKACAGDQASRYVSARTFKDDLIQAGIDFGVEIELPPDAVAIAQQIEDLLRAGLLDDALAICPPEWNRTRKRIEEKQALLADESPPLLVVDGVELRFSGSEDFAGVNSASTRSHDFATGQTWSVTFPDGGVLQFAVLMADVDADLDVWVTATKSFDAPTPIAGLVGRQRVGVELPQGASEKAAMRLRVAVQKPDAPNRPSALKATLSDLNSLTGLDVESVLCGLGAIGVGTKEELLGETGRTRTELYVTWPWSDTGASLEVPAAAFFLSRVVPLFRAG